MDKMDFIVRDGVILRLAEDTEKKKSKKGDGVNAAIGLLQDLRTFQERVEAVVESQDIAENRSKISESAKGLEAMYSALLEIAQSGIRSIGQAAIQEGQKVEQTLGTGNAPDMEKPKEEKLAPKLPLTPAVPTSAQ